MLPLRVPAEPMSLQSELRTAIDAEANYNLTDPRAPTLNFRDGIPNVIVRYSGHDIRPKGLVEAADVIVIAGALNDNDPYVLNGKGIDDWVSELIPILHEAGCTFPEERNVTALHAFTVGNNQFVGALIRVLGP